MRILLFVMLLLESSFLKAQYKVTFQVVRFPSYHKSEEEVYIAGSFNNWNPGDTAYRLQQNRLTFVVTKGTLEYKFTRGSWDRTETAENGQNLENRILNIEQDTTVSITIKDWKDHFQNMKESTASKNVHILDTAFYMPQLNRYRRIWIYLPQSYVTANKKYPVLYMQDGQNLFDEATSYAGEWGIDETLDTLGVDYPEAIIIGIDNGAEKRFLEYSPYDTLHRKGEGDQYTDFLVHTLKPYIDQHYRTEASQKHTFIAGSSMGGLISFYAMLKYPQVFGGAGVFSPSFWFVPDLKNDIAKRGKKVKGKIYFYTGKLEGEQMTTNMLAIFNQLHAISKAEMTTVIRTDGRHNEATWRQEFPLFYKWLLKSSVH